MLWHKGHRQPGFVLEELRARLLLFAGYLLGGDGLTFLLQVAIGFGLFLPCCWMLKLL